MKRHRSLYDRIDDLTKFEFKLLLGAILFGIPALVMVIWDYLTK